MEKANNRLIMPYEQFTDHIDEEIKKSEGWLRHAERKLDKCNHLMELMRTSLALCTLVLQIVILLKLFNVI